MIMVDITLRQSCEPRSYALGFVLQSQSEKDLEMRLEDSNLENNLHPDEEKSFAIPRSKLCFVDAPTRGDYLHRFRVTTHACRGQIELPEYFWYLNEDAQAWVTGIDVLGFGHCIISKDVLEVSVEVSVDGNFSVLIIGTQRDVDDLARMHFDYAGNVEV